MTRVNLKSLPVIDGNCFRPMLFSNCGISVYKNVVIFWDGDYDTRVTAIIDELELLIPQDYSEYGDTCRLIAIQERKGGVELLWDGYDPITHNSKISSIDVAGDCFGIVSSKAI